MTVTFFGHSDTPESLKPVIKEAINKLIIEKSAKIFYVVNQGNFDRKVICTLSELKTIHPTIEHYIVLAYLPENNHAYDSPSLFPEKVAMAPKRFAIAKRNDWMLDNSDTVVTYVKYSTGGAAKYKEKAEKKNKTVINIAESETGGATPPLP